MVKDQQVRRLVKLKKNEKTLTMAAAKAGLSRKTARKYLKSGKATEPVSAGTVLENSIGSVRVGMAGGGRDPEAIADGGSDSGVRVFMPSAGRGLPARPVENAAAQDQAVEGRIRRSEGGDVPAEVSTGTSSPIGLYVYGTPGSDDPGPAVSPSAVPLRVGLLELGSDHAVFQ